MSLHRLRNLCHRPGSTASPEVRMQDRTRAQHLLLRTASQCKIAESTTSAGKTAEESPGPRVAVAPVHSDAVPRPPDCSQLACPVDTPPTQIDRIWSRSKLLQPLQSEETARMAGRS